MKEDQSSEEDRKSEVRSERRVFRVLRVLRVLPSICCLLAAQLSAQSPFDAFPSQEIALADWGLTDAARIGRVHIGILHQRSGDALVIYDVRSQRPLAEEPNERRSQTPSFDGALFLVSHFDRGNTNRLGGYFNGFARSPSESAVAIGQAPDATPALIFSYSNTLPSFAGFWIHLFDFKQRPADRVFLDASPFTYLTFSIRGERGGEELLLQMADRAWEEREGSLVVGDVASFLPAGQVATTWQRAWIPLSQLPSSLNERELASLVFLVGGSGQGRVFVKDLAFTTRQNVQIPEVSEAMIPERSLNKAMWLWETENILTSPSEQQQLLAFCETQGITDLFLQLPYEANEENGEWEILWDPLPIQSLISQLHRAGVQVHALDGDPRFALTEWHGRVVATVESIIRYNHERPPEQRFDGIRLDIEPYLLPEFGGVQKEAILRQYLSLLSVSQTLTREADLSLGVDIPFWFDGRNEFFEPSAEVGGRPMSEAIIDIVDNVGIMDYRTQAYGADGTITHATAELQYAAAQGKEVFVGLETVELPDETDLVFSRGASSGSRLVVEAIGDQRIRIHWIPDGEWATLQRDDRFPEDVVVFGQTNATAVPSSKLTFAEKNLGDLEDVIRETASELRRFPSFHGFAIHSYESYRPWLERQQH